MKSYLIMLGDGLIKIGPLKKYIMLEENKKQEEIRLKITTQLKKDGIFFDAPKSITLFIWLIISSLLLYLFLN